MGTDAHAIFHFSKRDRSISKLKLCYNVRLCKKYFTPDDVPYIDTFTLFSKMEWLDGCRVEYIDFFYFLVVKSSSIFTDRCHFRFRVN